MAGARFEEAARRFEEARDLGAPLAEMAVPWASALIRLRRRAEACSLLEDASGSGVGDAGLRYRTGACWLRVGAPRRALPHLEAALNQGVSHAAASLDLAEAWFEVGRDDLAADLLAGLADEVEDAGMLHAIGRMLFRRVLYRQALEPLRKAVAARPRWYDARMFLGLAHFQLEQYQECVRVLAGLGEGAASPEARILRGSALARLGDEAGAGRELRAAVRLQPERADGYLNLGLFHLDQGRLEDALREIEQAAARNARGAKVLYRVKARANCRGLEPPSPSTAQGRDERRARFYTRFADTLLAGQQWGSALEVYLAALRADPRQARPYGGIGLICQELGTAEAGLVFVRRGLEWAPDDAELHYYLGSLHDYLAQPMEATESYRTALGLAGPDSAPARYWVRLGAAQLALGDRGQAEESIQRALAVEPDFAEAHYRLGLLRLGEGLHSQAERLLERAVELEPTLHEAYYSWGLACVRNGKREKGRTILEAHRRKVALRSANAGVGR